MPPTGHFGTFFATAAEKLLRGLYVRNSRRALCRSEAWVVPQVRNYMTNKLRFDATCTYICTTPTRLSNLLLSCRHPFRSCSSQHQATQAPSKRSLRGFCSEVVRSIDRPPSPPRSRFNETPVLIRPRHHRLSFLAAVGFPVVVLFILRARTAVDRPVTWFSREWGCPGERPNRTESSPRSRR